jgi:protocatechuate 3,4-dioxygenase beta subunit
VGSGYLLTGRVLSTPRCRPIARARVELWLANDRGRYDAAHRATIYTDRFGRYRVQTSKPPSYGGRPPHIHLRVTAAGHHTLVTQHYPKRAATRGVFDLVLERR